MSKPSSSPTPKDAMLAARQALGARIRQLRDESGLSIDDVVQHTEFSRSYLYAIEAGSSGWPSLDLICDLAGLFDALPLDFFIWPGGRNKRYDLHDLIRSIPREELAAVQAVLEMAPAVISGLRRRRTR